MALFVWTLALATVSAAAAPSGQPVRDRLDEIEVIGKAPPEIRHEAEDYVHLLGVANGERPAGRWLDPICPHSIGLDSETSAIVEQQVRSVAEAVGAPVAKAKCSANFLIVFTDDAKGIAHCRLPQDSTELGLDRRSEGAGEWRGADPLVVQQRSPKSRWFARRRGFTRPEG